MKARFMLVPASALMISMPVHAEIYMSIEQAKDLMFPGVAMTEDFRTLTREQAAAIEKASGVDVRTKQVKAWRAANGGWFIVDEVEGKHEFIPFALALDSTGAVKDVEILEYRESYGGEIRDPKWRAQFTGKTKDAKVALGKDIENISGATISSKHITDGIRRLLATHALVLANN